jgi:acyl transferase domain-containing protein
MPDDPISDTSNATGSAAEEQKAVTYLRRALVDLNETRRRLREAESRLAEPIAIVGMGCRYPGGVQSPEDLWELVSEGRDAVSELPRDRGWDFEALSSPIPGDPTATFKGGFIDGVCDFDAEFFGIDEAEARMMDPQQRLLLETAWEACEYAGIDPRSLSGSGGGVFTGIGMLAYGFWLFGAVSESPQGHFIIGTSGCMTSGRLAHVLKLEGPAITVDTACSSSSVALHLACQSLRQGDCSMAFAGGAAILATPWMYVMPIDRMEGFTIPRDARCRSFADTMENSTVFSEGVGMVLLERLSDARRLGHEVLGVIRGSAYNQDGVSNGLTAPNGLAHERVIRQALRNAGVSADQVDAVEAHGMGTVLGDPIEAQALLATYGRGRAADRPLRLGSLKSNLGHTQSAGGVGGVIKMVMAMRHGLLPKTLHVDAPSRFIDWSSGAVSLLVEPVPWVKEGEPRRAGVHSFGVSGTNVHIILEEPPPLEAFPPARERQARLEGSSRTPVPWPISGRGEDGLRRQAQRLAEFLAERPEVDIDIADVGRSLAARPALSHRAVPIGSSRAELLASVERVAEGLSTAEAAGDLASLAQTWIAGGAVDWGTVFAELDARPVRLPTYAFARRRYWVEQSPLWAAGGPITQVGKAPPPPAAAVDPAPVQDEIAPARG